MELPEALAAETKLGQRQGADKGGDFQCTGLRWALLMGLGFSGFSFPCAFLVPTFAIAAVETTVKKTPSKLLEIAVPFPEQKMSVHFPVALTASLCPAHCAVRLPWSPGHMRVFGKIVGIINQLIYFIRYLTIIVHPGGSEFLTVSMSGTICEFLWVAYSSWISWV